MTTLHRTTRTKTGFVSRIGTWLRAVVQKAQQADPQWDEELRRERTGKMGENIRGQEEIGPSKRP
jgi:hypothetical protein